MDRGKLKHLIDIYENRETDETDELGEKIEKPFLIGSVLASVEFRGGGLLTGRVADSVLTKTTHKFTYVYNNLPFLMANKNWIEYKGKKYNILFTLNEGETDEFLQVFTEEQEYLG